MAEQLVNEFTVNRPIDEAWKVLTDVERIAPCLPGAQLQEIEGETFRGVVKIKLGSITPQFKGQANFVQRDDEGHRAVLKAEGRDTGGRGNASAEIEARAESLSPTSTRVVVTTDLHITGKVAQFGRGIIGEVSKRLMAQFAGNLNTMLEERPEGATATAADEGDGGSTNEPSSTATAASAAEPTPPAPAPNGDADTNASALGADVPKAADIGPGAAPVAEAPKVRKIDSPASEPVDLAGVAGPAILKRLVPILAGLALVLLIVRRRR